MANRMERILRPALVHNGKIYVSGEPDYNWMKFSPRTGRILAIGRNEPPPPTDDSDTPFTVVDAKQRRIFPGFHDAHLHVASIGHVKNTFSVHGSNSIEELQNRLKAYVDSQPGKEWIIGRGWEQDVLGRYPTKEDIDAVCSDRYVILKRVCSHIWVVNQKVLDIAGYSKDTPNPPGGIIDRQNEDHSLAGHPTGVLRESAVDLIEAMLTPTPFEKFDWIITGIEECMRNGLTSVHSNELNLWNEYKHLAYENLLPIRVFLAAYYVNRDVNNFPKANSKLGDRLSCDRVKIFADGALGPKTAALSENYKGTNSKGTLLYSAEQMQTFIQNAHSEGFRLEVHVIGDVAAEQVLDVISKVNIPPTARPILTHCQILREDLADKMKELGVIANIQPQFLTTDARWLNDMLPDSLHQWAYSWKSLIKKGIVCSGGSDAPVESPQPMLGIYDAIFRPPSPEARGTKDLLALREEECLSVQEAVDMYTKLAAYTTMRENDLGQLLPGYIADFVIIDSEQDPVEHPEFFLTAKVAELWVGGIQKDIINPCPRA